MLQIFAAVLPVFAVVALGYAAARAEVVRDRLGPWLARIVFTVALPVLVFRTMAAAGRPEASPWALWGAYFGGSALVWAALYGLARWGLRLKADAAAIVAFGGAYSNLLLIALSVVYRLYGENGALPLLILLSLNLPLMIFAATLHLEWAAARSAAAGIGAVAYHVVRGALRNPIMLALFAGLVYRQTGLGIAAGVDTALKGIGAAAVQGALFSLGVSLAVYGVRGQYASAATIVAAKLVLHPLVVWFLAGHMFDLPASWVAVATIAAAAPTGINVYLIAARYRVAVGAISGAIALGTALSALTITALLLSGGV